MAFDHKHLIDITEYSADDIMTILETAKTFKQVNERRIKKVPTLKGFTVVNMFNEPSTRTRSSFEIAEKRLSADSLNFGGSSTATVKGESLVDTVKTLCSYKIDCIVVRDRWAGVPRKIADVSGVSVIDAGDGKHQHPTQALLDLYSIWEEKGSFDNLHVGVVGDISHSRVCGSLIPALKIMGCEVTVIAPPTLLPARPDILGADHVTSNLDEALPELDVVYMLRIQRERFEGAPYPEPARVQPALRTHRGARQASEARCLRVPPGPHQPRRGTGQLHGRPPQALHHPRPSLRRRPRAHGRPVPAPRR